ncbi:hypothetical protein AAHC03_016667 [Spirometra sp. Aus1]
MGDPHFAHVVIDGSVLEGGGQILRNAVSLSVLAKKAVTIEKIRAGRPKPGLRGYYPRGGGKVKVVVQPVAPKLTPITLHEIGSISRVFGSAFVAGKVPIKVAEEMSAVARRLFRNHLPECPINISAFRAPDNRFHGSVATFLFVLETSTGCRLAASRLSQPRGPSAEDLVTDAIEELMSSVRAGSCCDENMQDMLVLPMALADGKSSLRTTAPTLHTQSAIYVAEKLLPVKFVVEEQANGTVLLSCEGVGLSGSSP